MKNGKRNIAGFYKSNDKMGQRRILSMLLVTLSILSSCINDAFEISPSGYGEEVSVSLSVGLKNLAARGYNDGVQGSAEDKMIRELRVLIFDTNGDIAYNKYIPDLAAENPFPLLLKKEHMISYSLPMKIQILPWQPNSMLSPETKQ